MSNRNPRDQINKASWILAEGIKDTLTANITSTAKATLKIEPETLSKLLNLINVSVEEGYHKGSRVFSRTVDAAFVDAELPELKVDKTKKNSG